MYTDGYCNLEIFSRVQEDFNEEIIKNSSTYKTNKILVADQKVFLGKAAYLENKPANPDSLEQNISDISDKTILAEDACHCFFYSENNN